MSGLSAYVPPVPPRLGEGQTWKNVKSSRSFGTSYRNTTGRTITVIVSVSGANNQRRAEVSSTGTNWVIAAYLDGSSGIEDSATIIVPDGWFYRVTGGAGSMSTWVELS